MNIDDTLSIIEWYNTAIKIYSSVDKGYMKPASNNDLKNIANINSINKIKVVQFARTIAVCNEMIGDNPNDDVIEGLSSMLLKTGVLDRFKINDTMSDEELRRYVRNLFAHANYTLTEDNEVLISFGDIELIISIDELSDITKFYADAYLFLSNDNHNIMLDNLHYLVNVKDVTKLPFLRKSIDCIRKGDNSPACESYCITVTSKTDSIPEGSMDELCKKELLKYKSAIEDGSIYERKTKTFMIGNSLGFLENKIGYDGFTRKDFYDLKKIYDSFSSSLSDHEKEMLEYFVRYNIDWNKMGIHEKYFYLQRFNDNVLSQIPIITNGNKYNTFLLELVEAYFDGEGLRDEPVKMPPFECPMFGVIHEVINLSYFCFGFLKEKGNDDSFYSDYSLSDVDIDSLYTTEEVVSDYSNILKNEKSEILKKIKKIEGIYKGLEKGLKGADISKQNEIKEKIQICSNDIKKLRIRLNEIDKELEYPNHVNQTYFFGHIRNSLTHGYYSIDYYNGLKNRDMLDCVITFKDYNKDTKQETYNVSMTIRNLLKYCNKFRVKLEIEKQKRELKNTGL